MNILQITPGAGGMYCGGCFRDNTLVAALRRLGHEALMVPLYLPLALDEPDESAGSPIFFGGINVFLDQKSAFFRRAPGWLHRLLSLRPLLHWAAGRAAKTRAAEAGDLMLSMLRGEQGHQARELSDLLSWLNTQLKPDVICLSNVLLAGLARRLKTELRAPVVCLLAGEDTFLDALPEPVCQDAWALLQERCAELDLFLPPTRYYAELMSRRLALRPSQVQVLANGINLDGFAQAPGPSAPALRPDAPPVLGYFARMCREKGLDHLIDAYLLLKQREAGKHLRLHVGGGCGPTDEPFVAEQRRRLSAAGVLGDTQFFPNVDHAAKIGFFQQLTIFSTPAHYGEAFGLYVIEALAAGVPVVQPHLAAFPELIEATGGGVLSQPNDAGSLATAIEGLLLNPEKARALGAQGQSAVRQHFSRETMAENFVRAVQPLGTSQNV